jgi:hypothetical protein
VTELSVLVHSVIKVVLFLISSKFELKKSIFRICISKIRQ